VRFFRFLVLAAVTLGAVALLGPIVALTPVGQSFLLSRTIGNPERSGARVRSASIGLSGIQLSDVSWQHEGVTLSAPEISFAFPLWDVLLGRHRHLQKVVANGWRIELGADPAASPAARGSASEAGSGTTAKAPTALRQTLATLHRRLASWRLPVGVSIDQVEADGEILLESGAGREPIVLHVTASGGTFAAGRTADLSLTLNADFPSLSSPVASLDLHGRLKLPFERTGVLPRAEFAGTLSPSGSSAARDVRVTAEGLATGSEKFSVSMAAAERTLLAATAARSDEGRQFAGTWQLDLRRSEIRALLPASSVASSRLTASGRFAADLVSAEVRVTGTAEADLSRVGGVTLPKRPEAHAVGATFSVEFPIMNIVTGRASRRMRVTELQVRVGAGEPAITLDAACPLTWTAGLLSSDAGEGRASFRARLHALPLAWLGTPAGLPVQIDDGVVDGEFSVYVEPGSIAIHPEKPVVVSHLRLRRGERELLRGVTVAAVPELVADANHHWVAQPFSWTTEAGGAAIASGRLAFEQSAEKDRLGTVDGVARIDLDALRRSDACPALAHLTAKSAEVQWKGTVGPASDVTVKLALAGHAPGHEVRADFAAAVDDFASADFRGTLAVGPAGAAQEIAVRGKWARRGSGQFLEADITGRMMSWDDARWLGPLVVAASGAPMAERAGSARAATAPFWGETTGRIRVDLLQVKAAGRDWNQVGATLGLSPRGLELNGGRASFNPVPVTKHLHVVESDGPLEPASAYSLAGSLRFEPGAGGGPYRLDATGSVNVINSARILGAPVDGQPPVIEGLWSVALHVTGSGATFPELWEHREEQYRIAGHGGAVRVLATDVAAALPENSNAGSEALVGVGSAVGAVFGVKRNSLFAEKHVSRKTDAILNFTWQTKELPFDEFAVTATKSADGSIRLSDLQISAPSVRIAGTGLIGFVSGVPIDGRPFQADLRLQVKGAAADRLALAGLLAPQKSAEGFSAVVEPIHVAGSLRHVDTSPWRDVLLRAALAPEPGKAEPATAKPAK
jgi:hypothetical protein